MSNQETKMLNNWEVFHGLIEKKLSDEYKSPLLKLCDSIPERIITAPASSRTNYVGAFPGGLVWHSLNVLRYMKDLNELYGNKVSKEDLIVVGLFHDIGKIGTEDQEYYVQAKSSWHQENGQPFQINTSLSAQSVPTLSLWWLNKYQVPLSSHAIDAIIHSRDLMENNAKNLYNLSPLAMITQQAIWAACVYEKGREEL